MDENQNPTLVEPTEPGTGSGGGGAATATAPTPPPPPPPTPPPTYPVRPQLRRSRTDRVAAGVCGGIARQYGIDAVLLRILVVVATLFTGGVFLIAYVLAWVFIPDDPPLVALVAPGQPVPPAGYASGGTGSYVDPATGQVYGAVSPVTYAPARRTEPRSYLGLLTVSASVVVGALLALVDGLGAHISGLAIFASMLAVLGIGLVVGAWRGRARWLIAPALVLLLLVQGTAAVHSVVGSAAGAGDRRWTPTVSSTSYELGAGSARLDLRSLPAGSSTVHVQLGLGELIVLLPRDTNLTLHAKVGAGEVKVPGQQPEDGVGLQVVDRDVPAQEIPAARNVTVDTQVGLGTVEVRYASS